ncbi:SGNH/GDSL hydrolase family protein [Actinotalea subterranea]|uniref:SGNH/GDSL hydrolase family protein n=1 Tax=Actinotalea subterranea TaxID=2607497 RepID=UPI0011EC8409|nr:SGNH/GDSL hydrolase family protein [Actinotalea subterranea]
MTGRLLPVADNPHVLVRVTGDRHLSAPGERVRTTSMAHRVHVEAASVRLGFANWYDDGGREADGPAPIEVRSALELRPGGRGAGTVTMDVRFDGHDVLELPPGAHALSDGIGLAVAPGDVLVSRTVVRVPPGGRFPLGPQTDAAAGEWSLAQDLLRGPAPAPSTAYGYAPWALLGEGGVPGAPVGVVLGDSNGVGFGDRRGTAEHLGWVHRALAGHVPYLNLSVSGATADDAARVEGLRRRLALAAWVRPTWALSALGTNDLQGPGPSAARARAALESHWRLLAERGWRVLAATVPPIATDDGPGACDREAARSDLNAWLRSCPAPVAAVVDVARAVEMSGGWLPGCTDDGVHLSEAGHTRVAALAGEALRDAVGRARH